MNEPLNHWMNRDDITRGIVSGEPGTAVCGVRFVPHAQGVGGTSAANLPVCEECEVILSAVEAIRGAAETQGAVL